MYKLVGALVILCACTAYGAGQCVSVKKRKMKLIEFKKIIEMLRTEIALRNAPLPKAMHLVGCAFGNEVFLNCAELIPEIGAGAAFAACVKNSSRKWGFTDDDVLAVTGMSDGLGKCTLEEQLRKIDYTLGAVEKQILQAEHDVETKCRLYMGSSVLAGAFAVLLLV